jgi:putative transposase
MKLTETIQVRKSKELSLLCHLAKNLYNLANYHYRQFLFHLGEFITYYDLQVILKDHEAYKVLPAQTSQQILRLVMKNWKSYWNAIKEYSKDKSKFLGCPKMPNYKRKDGESIAIFTNQNSWIKNGHVQFPKSVIY